MATKKTTTPKRGRAKKAAPEEVVNNSVVVINTHVGHDLIIRANPSNQDVLEFVKEHHRRYLAGEPAGPVTPGLPPAPAYRLFNAKRYATEEAYLAGDEHVDEIDLADILAP